MNFFDLAKERYSCRSFAEKEVEMEKIEKILEAAKELDNVSEEDVASELVNGLELVTGVEIKQKVKKA